MNDNTSENNSHRKMQGFMREGSPINPLRSAPSFWDQSLDFQIFDPLKFEGDDKEFVVLQPESSFLLGKACLEKLQKDYKKRRQQLQIQRDYAEFNSQIRLSLKELLKIKGDTSCVNNARSEHIQCAINPEGNCSECKFYEKRG